MIRKCILQLAVLVVVSSFIPPAQSSFILLQTRRYTDRSSYHDSPAIRPFTGGSSLLNIGSGIADLPSEYPLRIRRMDYRSIFNI